MLCVCVCVCSFCFIGLANARDVITAFGWWYQTCLLHFSTIPAMITYSWRAYFGDGATNHQPDMQLLQMQLGHPLHVDCGVESYDVKPLWGTYVGGFATELCWDRFYCMRVSPRQTIVVQSRCQLQMPWLLAVIDICESFFLEATSIDYFHSKVLIGVTTINEALISHYLSICIFVVTKP